MLVVETNAPGGQAGASSKIENYLGFPTGISGQDLAGRAYTQAQKFGAQIVIAKGARELACAARPYAVQIDDDLRVPARTVIIATGAGYRRLELENLAQFEGAGVYYGATLHRGAAVPRQRSGGGRRRQLRRAGGGVPGAARRARLHAGARRGPGRHDVALPDPAHRGQPADHAARPRPRSSALEGGLRARARAVAAPADRDASRPTRSRHVFVMTGAVPQHRVAATAASRSTPRGSSRPARICCPRTSAAAKWPLARPPHLLETSLPGVFAVGDVRGGNIKRVASAVGEGSIAVAFVHRVLERVARLRSPNGRALHRLQSLQHWVEGMRKPFGP